MMFFSLLAFLPVVLTTAVEPACADGMVEESSLLALPQHNTRDASTACTAQDSASGRVKVAEEEDEHMAVLQHRKHMIEARKAEQPDAQRQNAQQSPKWGSKDKPIQAQFIRNSKKLPDSMPQNEAEMKEARRLMALQAEASTKREGRTKRNACDVPSQPLKAIPEFRSENGLMDVTLTVEPAVVDFPEVGMRTVARTYNGIVPGPTLLVRRGDRINITIVNKLGPQDDVPGLWRRREGWDGVDQVKDGRLNPQYQDVGQNPMNKIKMVQHMNNFHLPNSTNFHTHGFHVSPLPGQDFVLMEIPPGESFKYSYELSPYHSSANSWYHGHFHGTTDLQGGGGMNGAIIVQDCPGEIPGWLSNMTTAPAIVLMEHNLQYFGPDYLKYAPFDPFFGCYPLGTFNETACALQHRQGLVAYNSADRLTVIEPLPGFGYGPNETPPIRHFFSTNGQFAPTLTIKVGEWTRFRIIYTGFSAALQLIFDDGSNCPSCGGPSDCEMRLISKDNAYLPKFPRKIKKGAFMGPGNRCQLIIRCHSAGTKLLRNNQTDHGAPGDGFDTAHQPILYLKAVEGDFTQMKVTEHVTEFPRYLADLTHFSEDEIQHVNIMNPYRDPEITKTLTSKDGLTFQEAQYFDFPRGRPGAPYNGKNTTNISAISQPVRFVINNQTFTEPVNSVPPELDTAYSNVMEVGKIYQYNVSGNVLHAWHMHTNPHQFVSFGNPDYKEVWGGYFEVGDWQDVIQMVEDNTCDPDAPCLRNSLVMRFTTDCYTGPIVFHCHVLYHEDLGMFKLAYSQGEDHTYDHRLKNAGPFKHPPEQCTVPGQQCAPPFCTDYVYADSKPCSIKPQWQSRRMWRG